MGKRGGFSHDGGAMTGEDGGDGGRSAGEKMRERYERGERTGIPDTGKRGREGHEGGGREKKAGRVASEGRKTYRGSGVADVCFPCGRGEGAFRG